MCDFSDAEFWHCFRLYFEVIEAEASKVTECTSTGWVDQIDRLRRPFAGWRHLPGKVGSTSFTVHA